VIYHNSKHINTILVRVVSQKQYIAKPYLEPSTHLIAHSRIQYHRFAVQYTTTSTAKTSDHDQMLDCESEDASLHDRYTAVIERAYVMLLHCSYTLECFVHYTCKSKLVHINITGLD